MAEPLPREEEKAATMSEHSEVSVKRNRNSGSEPGASRADGPTREPAAGQAGYTAGLERGSGAAAPTSDVENHPAAAANAFEPESVGGGRPLSLLLQ